MEILVFLKARRFCSEKYLSSASKSFVAGGNIGDVGAKMALNLEVNSVYFF